MEYEGNAFHDSFERGKASGSIVVSGTGVEFRHNKLPAVVLPLKDLECSLGGASDRLVFFWHPLHPDWKVFTADQNILKNPVLSEQVDSSEQIQQIHKKRVFNRYAWIGLLGCLVIGALMLWQLRRPMVRVLAEQVPVEWEEKLGELGFSQVTSGSRLITSDQLPEDLALMVSPLVQSINDKRFNYRFHIVEDETVNACALPGGHVIVNSELILRLDSSEALLGVLAHEIAHVNERHGIQGLINNAGTMLLVNAMIGDVAALDGVILDQGAELLILRNSRVQETEADELGWDYLAQANINPYGLIECFEIMAAVEVELLGDDIEGMGQTLSFLSTHPAMDDRIEDLKQKWQNLPSKEGFRVIPMDYAVFKAKLRQALSEGE